MSSLEQRDLFAESGILSAYDGSASLSQGGTLSYAAVSGPGEPRLSTKDRLYDQTVVDIYYRTHERDFASKNLGTFSECLKSGLIPTDYPRTGTALYLQQGEDDGSYSATSLNAGMLALMDSGIALQFLTAAVNIAYNSESGSFILDPDKLESQNAQALILFVFESRSRQMISSSLQKGKVSLKVFNKALKMAREASASIFDFYRKAVEKKFSKD
ncbi:RRP46 [Lepeophtheirus salmonis]|uniref:RRP46 n=1 Tax=Lepeophtheirus salmonis TaxID=72036 RepID=A0A7R8CFG0_LEPSM|nr:RRP46 [Lepeophtheirus salmonis]CAF2760090.1 RRP46 [Lepeophtheirus salmonis]